MSSDTPNTAEETRESSDYGLLGRIVTTIVVIICLFFGTWWIANFRMAIRTTLSTEAAAKVLQKYEPGVAGTAHYEIVSTQPHLSGEYCDIKVSVNGSEFAWITLKRFPMVGWVEQKYERK